MSSKHFVPALCTLAILTPLAPAVIVPEAANITAGAVIALMVVPVVVLRRTRWSPRAGSAVMALLTVAAVVITATGFGSPSEEAIQRYISIQLALGKPIDFDAPPLRGLPWDPGDLLLIAVACLGTAALLLALGRAVHQEERRDMLPLRWRWPLVMWGAALVLVSIPQAMVAGGTAEVSIMVFDGSCFGSLEEILFGYAGTAILILIPQPIVVGLGFGLWALLARTGHRPSGRVVGWVTLVPLLARDLMMTWMPVLGCARSSDEPAVPITLGWALFTLLPVVLIVLAVRVRRAKDEQLHAGHGEVAMRLKSATTNRSPSDLQ